MKYWLSFVIFLGYSLPCLAQNCTGITPTFKESTVTSITRDASGNVTATLSAPLTLSAGNNNQFIVLLWQPTGGTVTSTFNGQFTLTNPADSGTATFHWTQTGFPAETLTPVAISGNGLYGNSGIYDAYYTLTQDTTATGISTVTWHWTTNQISSTELIYGNQGEVGAGQPGNYMATADQTTGTTAHAATATNLFPGGSYSWELASSCFTNGVPDRTTRAFSTAIARRVNTSYTLGGFIPVPGVATIPNTLYVQHENLKPAMDAAHPGLKDFAGYGVNLSLFLQEYAQPVAGFNIATAKPAIGFTSTSQFLTYVTSGVYGTSTVTRTAFTGPPPASIAESGGGSFFAQLAVDMITSASIPTGGTACTSAGGAITSDGCAYPLTVNLTMTCTGFTCNLPTDTIWVDVLPQSAATSLIGPPVGCYLDQAGLCEAPCQHQATAVTDGCILQLASNPLSNATVTWDGFYFGTTTSNTASMGLGTNSWGDYYGRATQGFQTLDEGTGHYDGANTFNKLAAYCASQNVCNGHSSALVQQLSYTAAHTELNHRIFNVKQMSKPYLTFIATATNYGGAGSSICNTVYVGNGFEECADLVLTVNTASVNGGTLSGLQTSLAAGNSFYCMDSTKNPNQVWENPGNGDIGHLTAVNAASGTVNCESYVVGNFAVGDTFSIYQEFAAIPADAGSGPNTIISAASDMNAPGGGTAYYNFFSNKSAVVTISRTANTVTVTIPAVFTDTGSDYICVVGVTSDPTLNGCASSYTGESTSTTLTFTLPGANSSCTTSCGGYVENLMTGTTCYSPTKIGTTIQGLPFYIASTGSAYVSAVNPLTGTITLSGSGLQGFTAGSPFQCRRYQQPSTPTIHSWSEFDYYLWSQYHDYMIADVLSNFSNITQAQYQLIGNQRELALAMQNCRYAADVHATPGFLGSTLASLAICLNPTLRATFLDMEFQSIDAMVNTPIGQGTDSDNFLAGLQAWAAIAWVNDPNMGATNDPRAVYWIQQLAQWLYQQYNYSGGINYNPTGYYNYYYHEFPYAASKAFFGINEAGSYILDSSIGGAHVGVYWSEQAVVWPMFAWLYLQTGNGVIPNSGGVTYGQAYSDMEKYGNVFAWNATESASSVYLGKTVGEFSITQFDGFKWIQGTTSPSPLTITTTSLPAGIVGTAYSSTLAASGGTPPYTWVATGLPAGLMLNASTGQITGTPTAAIVATVQATVTDSASPANMTTKSLSLTITAMTPPDITTTSLPAGVVNIAYAATLNASGGVQPYTWQTVGLPPGLTLNATTGQITGIPAINGSYGVTVTVTGSANPPGTDTDVLVLTIAPSPTPSSFTAFGYPIP